MNVPRRHGPRGRQRRPPEGAGPRAPLDDEVWRGLRARSSARSGWRASAEPRVDVGQCREPTPGPAAQGPRAPGPAAQGPPAPGPAAQVPRAPGPHAPGPRRTGPLARESLAPGPDGLRPVLPAQPGRSLPRVDERAGESLQPVAGPTQPALAAPDKLTLHPEYRGWRQDVRMVAVRGDGAAYGHVKSANCHGAVLRNELWRVGRLGIPMWTNEIRTRPKDMGRGMSTTTVSGRECPALLASTVTGSTSAAGSVGSR
jgi:hypothetical protein